MQGPFKILLLTALFGALSWIILIPIWQYPDEQSHFGQVQDTAELGYTPGRGMNTSQEIAISEKLLGTERDWAGNNSFTYHPFYQLDYTNSKQGLFENFINNLPRETRTSLVKTEATVNPPLYHIMASNFYNLVQNGSLFTRVYSVRFFSLLLYLSLVAIMLNASKIIFTEDRFAQITLTSITAFTPMLVFSTTGVLPDPLTILIFTSILAICLKVIKNSLSWQLIILLVVLIFLGTKTRQQFQVSIPVAAFAVLYGIYEKVPMQKKKFFFLLLAILLLVLVCARQILPSAFSVPEIGAPKLGLIFTPSFLGYLKSTLGQYYHQTLPWYWGVYKWLSLTVPHSFYRIINGLILISSLGLVVWLIKVIQKRTLNKQDILLTFLLISAALYISIFIVWDFYFQRRYGYSFGVQGRYFMPLVLANTTVLFFGLREITLFFFEKYRKVFYFLLIVFFVVFFDASLVYVASSYYSFSTLGNSINQVSQYKPLVLKGGINLLIILIALLLQMLYLFKLFLYFKNEGH